MLPLLFASVQPIEPDRPAAQEDRRLEPPIDEVDVAYVELRTHAAHLRRLIELNAPAILLQQIRILTQDAFDRLVRLRTGETAEDRWEPYEALMTGMLAPTDCALPRALFADTWVQDETTPRDALILDGGFLVLFPYSSLVLGEDGAVRDVFPTCGLRPVAASKHHVLLVSGGGPTARSGYFSPTPIVRDLEDHRWVEGPLPEGLPRYVAGPAARVRRGRGGDLRTRADRGRRGS